MFLPYDTTILILIPTIIFTMYAQNKVQTTFNRYLRVPTRKGYTGYDVARFILDQNGLRDVPIEMSPGRLSDHYNPSRRILRLSRDVYNGTSIASVSVAAHEVGHAIQHARGYIPLTFRNTIFPIAKFGSSAAWFFIMAGLLFSSTNFLLDIGIILYFTAVLFQIITLPVEFNASNRALELLDSNGFIDRDEYRGSKKVLNAAALTYVAAMAAAVSQLIRLLVIRNRRE
ncbi:MAG: zinc metallopeptidase [Clostridiales bacterium]|nr:zinc metallopeptidase [Clostridiales bacterium]